MPTPTYPEIKKMIKTFRFALILVGFLVGGICNPDAQSAPFTYHWEIDETPEGSESATIVEPVEVTLLDEPIQVASHSASLHLMRKYSVYLDVGWDQGYADRLLKTFESIPQRTNNLYNEIPEIDASIWRLSDRHIQNDISVEYHAGQRIVTITREAFVYAKPLLAKIEGVRGRYFSKRLHRAVVRFVTDDGADRYALGRILQERYAVSVNIPDYSELTKYTTAEHAGRFSEFKNEELIAILSMLEEFPSGMLKTPGLKYLVRRLDGTPHPIYPEAPAVAWTGSGYIEFMESAFKEQALDYIHRLVLHEKAHFMWEYMFDDQLKQDWIEIGGWYENPDDKDGWSTTKQVEFVSAYAHGVNPDEDMAESISFYIVRPNKLRSRSPAKYEFIQNRVMHGTRYISKIREDLTFEVYNLYPDYVYPGRIIRVDIQVEGEPEEDKFVTIEVEIHSESDLDHAYEGFTRIFSGKNSYIDVYLYPIDSNGQRVESSHILRSNPEKVSKYAPNGYWMPDQVSITDANNNARYESRSDFGWQLYIDNPLADCEPPEYVPNSLKLSLRKSTDSESVREGGEYQVVRVTWLVKEENSLKHVTAKLNDEVQATYSREIFEYGYEFNQQVDGIIEVSAKLQVPDYHESGMYAVNHIGMRDIAGNPRGVYFSNYEGRLSDNDVQIDEPPATIKIQTASPDSTPPVLDLENITITAEPTNPGAPNGETNVHITFRVKDNISGYSNSDLYLRDPLGVMHREWHWISNRDFHTLYFRGDPTVYKTYEKIILLPVGSVPGIWGLAEMKIVDKARNTLRADFTEIVRFEVGDAPVYTQYDVNQDGKVNNADLGLVTAALGQSPPVNPRTDVDASGTVDGNDLLLVIENFDESSDAAPSAIEFKVTDLKRDQIQAQIDLLLLTNDNSLAVQQTLTFLYNLLALVSPDSTQLFANYPNPFNPETWIPYQLASSSSDVQITIYDMKGTVVRNLALGHQSAGFYTGRSRAAYWDGRNGLGERVASGVYFYQLRADDISFMRKMVIVK